MMNYNYYKGVSRLKKKVPIAVSVDEDLAKWISDESEHSEFRNKSHLVEEAIREFLKKREHQ
jgi:Arc/MetJ-type ribon-helix-helix transcriptional regulator